MYPGSSFSSLLAVGLIVSLLACTSERRLADLDRPLDTVVMRMKVEPGRLNPILATSASAMQVYQNIYSYLLAFDAEALAYRPQLVEARPTVREIEEGPFRGGKAFAFRIHEEAVWDDGQPVTGHDYAFSLKTILNPAAATARLRAYLAFIRDVQVSEDDPKAFEVITSGDFMQAEEFIGNAFPVLPAHMYDPDRLLQPFSVVQLAEAAPGEDMADDENLVAFVEYFARPEYSRSPEGVVGSGPYRLVSWEEGTRIRLEKKADWWGRSLADAYPTLRAYPQALEFAMITDDATSAAALRAEELDVTHDLAPSQFLALKDAPETSEAYQFLTAPSNAYYFLYLNQRDPLLQDVRVRRALSHAIDVDAILQGVYKGFGERLAGPVHPSAPYHNAALEPYAFDPDRARQLLDEAGWTDSDNDGVRDKSIDGVRQDLRFQYAFGAQSETSRNAALLIQDDLRQVGMDLDLQPMEARLLFENLRNWNYQIVSGGRTLSFTLWNPKQDYHREGDDRTGFGRAETDRLIDAILATSDAAQRRAWYRELQVFIYDNVPEIPLFSPRARIAVHKRFTPALSPLYPNVEVRRLQLDPAYAEGSGTYTVN